MYPENLTFIGKQHRTTRMHKAVHLIRSHQINIRLQDTKKGANFDFSSLPLKVIPLGFEPRTHTLKVYCSTS